MGGPVATNQEPRKSGPASSRAGSASGLPTADFYEQRLLVALDDLEDVAKRQRFQEQALAKLEKRIAEWEAEGEGWLYQAKRFEILLKASNARDAQLVSERGTIEAQRKTVVGLIDCARERESLDLVERAEEVDRRLDGHRGSRLTAKGEVAN